MAATHLNIMKPGNSVNIARNRHRKSSPIHTLTPDYGRGKTPLWNTFESMEFDFDITDFSDDTDDDMKDTTFLDAFDNYSFEDDIDLHIIKENQPPKPHQKQIKNRNIARSSVPPSAMLNIGTNTPKTNNKKANTNQTARSSLPPNNNNTLAPVPLLKASASVPMKKVRHYHVNTITIWSNYKEILEDVLEKEKQRFNESRCNSRRTSKQIRFKDMDIDESKSESASDVEGDVRNYLIKEIIETEESYVKGLNTLLYEFVIPMFEQKLIKIKYKEILTCNIAEILLFHGQFLKQLIGATSTGFGVDNNKSLVSVFYKLCNNEFVEMYTKYIREYQRMLDVYAKYNKSKKLQKYLKAKRKEKKPLTNHLILPIQRATRYLLLLEELRNKTPSTHRDYTELECVLQKINQTVHAINERQREIENMSQCLQVQETLNGLQRNIVESHRIFLDQFVFRKKEKQRGRQFFLFNDLLIITNIKLKVKALIEMRTIEIKRLEKSNIEFHLYSLHHKAIYQADEAVDLKDFLQLIEDNRTRIHQEELQRIGAGDIATLLKQGGQSVSGSSLKMFRSQNNLELSDNRSSDSLDLVDLDAT